MTCICESTWRALCVLKAALTSPCTSAGDSEPFANSSNNSNISNHSSNYNLEDHVIERDLGITNQGFQGDAFGGGRLEFTFLDPVTKEPHRDTGTWTNQSAFTEVDLGDGPATDRVDGGGGVPVEGGRTDSGSTTLESGYGRSLDDSNSSSTPEPSVAVAYHGAPSPGVFKVVVEDAKRCWFVLRRYTEFLSLYRVILTKVSPNNNIHLPDENTADCYNLNHFIQDVMGDTRTVNIPEVREFLQIDRFRSSTSSSGSGSSGANSTPSVGYNPQFLMPPGAPVPPRKPLQGQEGGQDRSEEGESGHPSLLDTQQSIDLGCEKKSLSPSDFEFLTVVGKGSFGKVMLARYLEDDKVYAVKVLNKRLIVRRNETAHVLSERSVLLKMMNHPYLVQLHFAFTTKQKIFFVLDYVNGGELFFHLQKERVFPEGRARFYAAEICCALTYMHSQGIVYRDLKPENILLDAEGHVVLTDFGLCKEGLLNPTAKTNTFCGTPEYLAPEILKKQPYSRAVDWWTLGAVLFEMLYGLPPFYSRETPVMYDAILNKPLKLKPSATQKARTLLQGLLQKDPRDRLGSSARDGEEVKEQEFFRTIDWDLIAKRAVAPPFKPRVSGPEDTRNVDPQFTKEAVLGHSPVSPNNMLSASVQAVDHVFQGFSYAPPLEIEAQ